MSIWKWTSDCHPFSRYLQALVLRQELFGWGSSRRTDDSSTCWACFEKGRLCNVPPKPKNVGKPAIHNNTVSFHVLDTAQDSLVVDNRVFIPQVLLNMYHVFQYINFLKLREDLDLRLCMIFCHAFVPLLCPFVGCRKNFSWRKAMPQTKSVIKGKPAVQDNTLSCYELGRVPDF